MGDSGEGVRYEWGIVGGGGKVRVGDRGRGVVGRGG